MKNWKLRLLVLFLIPLLLLMGCNSSGSDADQEPSDATILPSDEGNVISATGEIRPALWANLSFPVGGRVKTIHVQEGQSVTEGQPLVELDSVQLARTVAEAEAALSAAQANLAQTNADARLEDVATAEQAVAAALANEAVAQAQVEAAQAGLSRAQIEAAQAGLSQAQSAVAAAESQVGIAEAQVAIAEAGIKIAQAELQRSQAGARSEEIESVEAALEKARAAVRLAQTDYDRTDRSSDTPQALALQQATLDLQAVQANYDQLIAGPRQTDLAPLRAAVENARAQKALAEAQVSQAQTQVAQAGAQVAQAEAQVSQAQSAFAAAEAQTAQAQAGLEAARAGTAQARAALDRLNAGSTPEQVAVAEAAVAQAQEAVLTAQALRDQAVLTAPFAGTVGLIYVRQGEEVLPGQTVLSLGDLTTLRVETTDLDEIDIARVQVGQEVDLTFDALPEKVLVGRVAQVATMSSPGQGAVTYKLIIDIEETDPALRWGMTAFVDIFED